MTTANNQPQANEEQPSSLLVSPDWLAQHSDHPALRILDVRTRENYVAGHIPQAVWVDLPNLAYERQGVPGILLPPDHFAERMGALGVDQEKIVLIYDDHWGMAAARLFWDLAHYGHHQAVVLNGGWDRWLQEGRPHTTQPFVPPQTDFIVQPDGQHLAEREWLLEKLDDPDTVLVDTRSPREYAQGHVPQAICWDWLNGVPQGSWDAVRPAEELRAELAALGITPDKEIVTYCRSGVRAAHTYLLLRHLGYPRVRNYDGSWLEWSHYLNQQNGL